MISLKDALNQINTVLPEAMIDDGDNSGLLVGDLDQAVNHIRVALEATVEVIDKAIEDEVDLLIVHHPVIFRPVLSVTTSDVEGDKLIKLIKNNVALIAAHSNLDRMASGLNQSFGEAIGLSGIRPSTSDDSGYVLVGVYDTSIPLATMVEKLSLELKLSHVRYVGDNQRMIRRVAFCTGSGMSLLTPSIMSEADVYITGDLKYHDAMWVHENGFAVVDVTHFGSEKMAAEVLYKLLRKSFGSDIMLSIDTAIVNPIKISEV